MLKIQNLKKSFIQGEREIQVLKGLNLEIKAGETAAILGTSGSGKSTLLSLLAGIDTSNAGDMSFQGVSLNKLSEEERTKLRGEKIGIIFQQFHLIPHLNALENVSLPLEILGRPYQKESVKALEDVGLGHRLDHFPGQLSGGEKQRVAIARAMVMEPELLLADEPSGSLDEETGEQVMKLIFSLVEKKGTSLILVTHDEELARRCSSVHRLQNGCLDLEVEAQ
jgi:putative ABC transport system ATP-binding protein